MCINILTHTQGYTYSIIKKVIYAFYQPFSSTLKIISAERNILWELCQASKQDSVTNSTRRNAHNSAGNAHDFSNPQNNHLGELKEFRLHFWKGKKTQKGFLRREPEDEISYLYKSISWNKQVKNIASGNLQAGDHHEKGSQTVIVVMYWNLNYF